jgi:ATP-binding cassette subfamily C protein
LLDGIGLWLISKATIAWLDKTSPAIENNIANYAILGITFLIARSITVGLISYIGFRQLVKEEVRLALSNYDSIQSLPLESAKELPLSIYYDITLQSPHVAVHTLIINSATIAINLINILVIFTLLWSFDRSTAIGTLVYFSLLGMMQHFILTRTSSKIGEFKQHSFEQYQNDILTAFRFSKLFKVMKSNTFRKRLEDSRTATGLSLVNTKLIQLAPRLALEAGLVLGVIGLYLVGHFLGSSIENGTNIILFLLAGFRIIPILSFVQSLYVSIVGEMAYLETESKVLSDDITLRIGAKIKADDTMFRNREVLQLKNVSYSYPNSTTNAVESVSISFCRGKIYAIAGLPGSGKSTLMDLCLGLLEPSSGTIRSSGKELVLGYVPQDTDLFDGPISSNIALEWSDDAVDSLAMSRTLDIASKIDVLQGFISENGNAKNLSGGQKQLICLLRALYRNPDILFLDEATSSLDNSSDNQINEMLQSEKRNRAVIVIAHRLSSIKHADEIVFMDSGTVMATGTFDQIQENVKEFELLFQKHQDSW